ncbi:uncharacterized protein LOC119574263 [Penaeus monodon]|uniref:uncharacterized protein LOC119574263 n=1 Tax=Penaeus monodon TaxID=6687 RepID=UPI0018A6F933|nr:uncharacterized protein LOC119574263 [Penaeus monodon]
MISKTTKDKLLKAKLSAMALQSRHLLVALVLQGVLLAPPPVCAKFYIGRYKTVPVPAGSSRNENSAAEGRKMPYIVYQESAALHAADLEHNRRRIERPPMAPYTIRRTGDIGPGTLFGTVGNYGNPESGYTVVNKNEVNYVVPPFTPGGRVNVAFQFWIPISIGGFFVTGRDLEEALRSNNPTAYISSLFLKHLSENSTIGELLGDVGSPVVEQGVQKFLDWVMPYLGYFTGSDVNEVNTYSLPKSRSKRDAADDDGWTTIGGPVSGGEQVRPTATLITSSSRPTNNDRLLWGNDHVLSHNNIHDSATKRPGLDLIKPIDVPEERPRPSFSSRPTFFSRPSSSSYPSSSYPSSSSSSYPSSSSHSSSSSSSSSSYPSSSSQDITPPFHLTSFDEVPSGATDVKRLDVSMRLSRLDYFFNNLHLDREDCRRRVLCEVSRDPETFAPLSDLIGSETRQVHFGY